MKTKHLLIVDDSLVSRMKIKKALASVSTIEFTEAISGAECMKLVNEKEFDIILLDLLMPDIDGFEVLKTLQKQSFHIPIVVVSADIQSTTKKKCEELGAKAVVPKSVHLKEMKTVVHDLMKA